MDESTAVPVNAGDHPASSGPWRLFEIERGLQYYRTSLFEFFPFVIMPNVNQSAAEFVETKPCLAMIVAMLGSTKDRARQRDLTAHARAYIGDQIVQRGQKSLDLLQGLLLLLHW